jgi:hypothetical protein
MFGTSRQLFPINPGIDLTQVWPAFWSKGPQWPDNGEIDIIEGVNLMVCFSHSPTPRCRALSRTQEGNRYALHTVPGCSQPQGVWQTGVSGETDCSQPTGCFVSETSTDSYGEAFATAGGGVWATQFDVAGILCVDELIHYSDNVSWSLQHLVLECTYPL